MDSPSGATAADRSLTVIVGDVMRPAVTTVERHAHLAGAAYLMKHAHDSAVVVTTDDESRQPVAIVTETDITHAVADGRNVNETRIDDIIGLDPVTASPGTTVREAAWQMLSAHIRHLPVVEEGRLVGIVDMTDACRALMRAVTEPAG